MAKKVFCLFLVICSGGMVIYGGPDCYKVKAYYLFVYLYSEAKGALRLSFGYKCSRKRALQSTCCIHCAVLTSLRVQQGHRLIKDKCFIEIKQLKNPR